MQQQILFQFLSKVNMIIFIRSAATDGIKIWLYSQFAVFECGVCGEKFEFSKGLGNHIFTKHYFDERFPQNRRERAECYLCKEQLKSIPAARKHIVNKHILQLRKRCGICDVGLTTAVKKHSCAGLKLDCEYCSKSFNSLHRLKGHLISHAAKSSYTCDICSAQYQMLAFMENHRLSHSREYFNCSQCPEKFSTFSERQMHMPTHSKNRKSVMKYENSRKQSSTRCYIVTNAR